MGTREGAPKKRKGRPLLVAAAGVAFVSFVQCTPKEDHPVGNLRGPDPVPSTPDAGEGPTTTPTGPIEPVGNLRPAPALDAGAPAPALDAGAPKPKDAGPAVLPKPPIPPVGNLRPPQ